MESAVLSDNARSAKCATDGGVTSKTRNNREGSANTIGCVNMARGKHVRVV